MLTEKPWLGPKPGKSCSIHVNGLSARYGPPAPLTLTQINVEADVVGSSDQPEISMKPTRPVAESKAPFRGIDPVGEPNQSEYIRQKLRLPYAPQLSPVP